MQSVSSQKEHGSSDSAAERAGQTSTALLECQKDLKKRPYGSVSPVLAVASARLLGKDCKGQGTLRVTSVQNLPCCQP